MEATEATEDTEASRKVTMAGACHTRSKDSY